MQSSRIVWLLWACLAWLSFAGLAEAQPASGNVTAQGSYGATPKLQGLPTYAAPGFKLGGAALHPGLNTSFGYDSNVFYSSSSEAGAGSVMLLLRPSLTLENASESKGKRKIEYSVALGFEYKRYFQELRNRTQRDFFGANLAGILQVFPAGVFGFDLHETFLRTSEPRYATSNLNFDRDHNTAGLGFSFRPGGGMLSFRVGYRITVDYFEDSDLKGADYYFHQVELYGKWKFFPQTSVWLGATWQFIDYWNDNATGTMYRGTDSKPIRIMAGVSGRFLPRLVLTGGIGYGYSWYSKGPDFNLPLGMVDVTIEIGPFAKLSLGYEHNFQDVMLGNFYELNTIYLTYYHLIANRVELSATARWIMADFQGIQPLQGMTCQQDSQGYCERTDQVLLLGLQGRYIVTDWFSAGLMYRFVGNFSDFEYSIGGASYTADYQKHVALVTAVFSY